MAGGKCVGIPLKPKKSVIVYIILAIKKLIISKVQKW